METTICKLFLLIVEYNFKISVKNRPKIAQYHGSPCIWRQGFSWRRFLNFDPICLSFWVITKTRRLVLYFHLPDYALILGCVTVAVVLCIQARTCKATMHRLHSLKESTHFRELIFKTTARFFFNCRKTMIVSIKIQKTN